MALAQPASALAGRLAPTLLLTPTQSASLEFAGASHDGTRVIVETRAALSAEDTDRSIDAYEVRDGDARLLTAPQPGASGDGDIDVLAVSADGRRIVVSTEAHLTLDDTDAPSGLDFFLIEDHGPRLLTGPAPGATGNATWWPEFASADSGLRRVVFRSAASLTADDTDTPASDADAYDASYDLFVSEGGHPDLVSRPHPAIATEETRSVSGGWISADGSTIAFQTGQRLTLDDDESPGVDLFAWVDGHTRLVTSGGSFPSSWIGFDGISADGAKIYFSSFSRMASEDRDDLWDGFMWEDGRTTLLTTTSGPEPRPLSGSLLGGSADSGRLLVLSDAQLDPADGDDTTDLFLREPDGSMTLVTGNHSDPGRTASFPRGWLDERERRIVFATSLQLLPTDTDAYLDVYAWSREGGLRLLSPGGSDDAYPEGVELLGLTRSGTSAILRTRDRLTEDDADDRWDLYEHDGAGLALLTRQAPGTPVDDHPKLAWWSARRLDDERLLIATREQLGPIGHGGAQIYALKADDASRSVPLTAAEGNAPSGQAATAAPVQAKPAPHARPGLPTLRLAGARVSPRRVLVRSGRLVGPKPHLIVSATTSATAGLRLRRLGSSWSPVTSVPLRAGKNRISLRRALTRLRARPGRYEVRLAAVGGDRASVRASARMTVVHR